MLSLTAHKSESLTGTLTLPGDKSISHRALICATLAQGTTTVSGLLESHDVCATATALRHLGGQITRQTGGIWLIDGIGLGAFREPTHPLDLGNSGTGARLLMGAVAGSGITAVFTGDASLAKRPMARITQPLALMGAEIIARNATASGNTHLPVTIKGTATPRAIEYASPHASAQVKSALLLAGLTARGRTTIIEPTASRNHTETLLQHFGARVESEPLPDGRYRASVLGEARLNAKDITVPADPSSAAFLAVAALITEGSHLTLKGIGTNPLRFGLFETLLEMGADIRFTNTRMEGGEPVADMEIRHSPLRGVAVPPSRAASMIDEYPILAIAASMAEGATHCAGIGELRVKETDRIALMEGGLIRAGVEVQSTPNTMTITGSSSGGRIKNERIRGGRIKNERIRGGVTIDACHDHRIAMAFLVLGLATAKPITVTGAETIATSFPNFVALMQQAGANIEVADSTEGEKP